MSFCEFCEAPLKSVWPPSERQPKLQKIRQLGWLGLHVCPSCNVAWVDSPYEPYASFRYLVYWPFSLDDFSTVADLKDGETISAWCSASILEAWTHMGAEDIAAVDHHRQRSYGRNPIDEPKVKPDLSEILSQNR